MPTAAVPAWYDPVLTVTASSMDEDVAGLSEFVRLWRGFMTARVTLGLVLLTLQITLMVLGQSVNTVLPFVSGGYFIAALAVRLLIQPRHLGSRFGSRWALTIGLDIAAFSALQVLQGGSINYGPLLALPVLLAAVLGTLFLAMGTAAVVSLLLLAYSSWVTLLTHTDTTAHFAQSALMGAGCFVMAFLSNQVSTRLAQEEQRARQNQMAAQAQRQVNELIIETLADGVLVVDIHGQLRAANPAARRMLGPESLTIDPLPNLHAEPPWSALADLAAKSFEQNDMRRSDVTIHHRGQGLRRLQVRAQLTGRKISAEENLCVIFLQDQREMEARMRTEKLASMGRMSAAVAHEIRNPLAAITQANALLEEETADPKQLQLIHMVAQNAVRLGKIVDEVLNIARVQARDNPNPKLSLDLNEAVSRIGADWTQQTQSQAVVLVSVESPTIHIEFDADHLRRVMVNLLDNARRYAGAGHGSIQARTRTGTSRQAVLDIWSDGPPIEPTVEQHLFEPFFSSESRSSGLGLYICRELCEGHGAAISYQRSRMQIDGVPVEGNQFSVTFRRARSDRRAGRERSSPPEKITH
jgi:two-component system, NtrC family, sensor histidine kinase PilS